METGRILNVATFAGQIILENGGETYRVEETISRICRSYGIEVAEGFVTPTGIMASASSTPADVRSVIKRVKHRTVNLDKISRVNELARQNALKPISVDDFYTQLQVIDASKAYPQWVVVATAALAAAAFTLMFGGTGFDALAALVSGYVAKYLTVTASRVGINDFFVNVMGGAVLTILGLLSVLVGVGDNPSLIIIGSMMLLVPGLAITNAIRDTLAGDLVAGVTRGAEAFLIAVSLAAGSGIVVGLWIQWLGGID